ncbi:MAG: MerR family transcriptional regulator [Nitrospira sp.]|nr:MerR family transcriptional regulator [Nitrospira sp.]
MKESKRPLFMIGVVCEMFNVHPQTLRMYEKEGLLRPRRVGGARTYSTEDLDRIRMILNLTKDLGVNRAGVDIILRMRRKFEAMQKEMDEMMEHLEKEMQEEFREKIKEIFEEE